MAGDAFQKIKSSFNRGVTAISITTSSSLEKVKIRTHIESINTEIGRLISTTGEAAYRMWECGASDFFALNEQFALIKQKKDEIAQLEVEYASIDERDNQILGAPSANEMGVPTPTREGAEEIICPNCGSAYYTQVKFCRKCGHKLRE